MNEGERKGEVGGEAVYKFGAEETDFFRPFTTHGLRRGLHSFAALRLWFSNSVQHSSFGNSLKPYRLSSLPFCPMHR